MKTLLFSLLTLPSLLLADASDTVRPVGGQEPTLPKPSVTDPDKLKQLVQITELACMRTMLIFQKTALDVERTVTQKFSDADFRVFGPYETTGDLLPDATQCRKLGTERKSDLVVLTSVTSRELNKLGNFVIYEAEATVRVYSPVSAEIMSTHTSRVKGERHTQAVEAERSAREKAAAAAVDETIKKSLHKAQKILVHEALIGGVQDRAHLEEILANLRGHGIFYNVREMDYDAQSKIASLELIGDPASEEQWREIVSKIPTRDVEKVVFKVIHIKNEEHRRKYPAYFDGK